WKPRPTASSGEQHQKTRSSIGRSATSSTTGSTSTRRQRSAVRCAEVGYQQELTEAARRETGLDHFGNDSFREGFERLVRSVEDESDLNAIGQEAMRSLIVGLLAQ